MGRHRQLERSGWTWSEVHLPYPAGGAWGRRLDSGIRDLWKRAGVLFGLYSGHEDADAAANEPRIRLLLSGRVQGVGYRAWVLKRALELGVRGWVRNCRDGSVEVEASGPLPLLLRLRELVTDGPPLAHVTDVREEPPRQDAISAHFEIR